MAKKTSNPTNDLPPAHPGELPPENPPEVDQNSPGNQPPVETESVDLAEFNRREMNDVEEEVPEQERPRWRDMPPRHKLAMPETGPLLPEVDAAVLLELPVTLNSHGHASININVAGLTIKQAAALEAVRAAADKQNARLNNDRRVVSTADAVRFLLERVAAVLEELPAEQT